MLTQKPIPSFNSPVTSESIRANLSPLSAKHTGLGLPLQPSQRAPQVQKARKKPTCLFPKKGDSPRAFSETRLIPQGILGLLNMNRSCYPALARHYLLAVLLTPLVCPIPVAWDQSIFKLPPKDPCLTLKPYHQKGL